MRVDQIASSTPGADLEVLRGGAGREAGGRVPAGVSLLPGAAQLRLHDTLMSNIFTLRKYFYFYCEIFSVAVKYFLRYFPLLRC